MQSYRKLIVIVLLAPRLRASDPPTVIQYNLPDQYSETAYAGPLNLWYKNGFQLIPKDASAMGGISVSAEGDFSGKLAKVTEPADRDFTLCEVRKLPSQTCDQATRLFQFHVRVLPLPADLSFATKVQTLFIPQYAGEPYRGPNQIAVSRQKSSQFKRLNPKSESHGITLDDQGEISGKLDDNFTEKPRLLFCVNTKNSCAPQYELFFNIQKAPEFQNPDLEGGAAVAANVIVPVKTSASKLPVIRDTLAPGQKELYANGNPSLDNGAQTRVYPFINGQPTGVLDDHGNVTTYATTDNKGQAYLRLQAPLAADDRVQLVQQKVTDKNSIEPPPADPDLANSSQVSDPLDLGRARYYFTSGIVLSNSQQFALQSSSTNAGLFLDLTADRAWAWSDRPKWDRWGINTFFDARLTSVATQSTATAPQATTTPTPGGTSTGASTTTTTQTSPTLEQFIRSQKAATLQIGAYLPFRVSDWPIGSSNYGFFVAPLAKAGFTTLTDDQQSVLSGDTGRFFTSYSFGGRFDLSQIYFQKRSKTVLDPSRAPRSVGYLDITVGRFGNFEAFRDLTAEQGASAITHNYLFARPWRYSFEGFLKIPHTVFLVGMSANIGMGAHPADKVNGITLPYTQIRDDLRFLFGAQFDVNRLLRSISTMSPN